ncbi:SPX-domain-containing protein, partial [Parathielavia hyrcaniae]
PRFAKELDQEAVPEWRVKYLNYKAGKKHVKAVTRAINRANATPILTRRADRPPATTPATFFGIRHNFTPPRKNNGPARPGVDDEAGLARSGSAAAKPGKSHGSGDERSGLARSPGSGIQYGSFGPSPSHSSGRHDFALPAPAIRAPSATGALQRSASMMDAGPPEQRTPSLLTLPSGMVSTTPRLRVPRLFSTPSSMARQTPNKSEICLQNLDYVRSAERDFFAFLDSELDKIETFYKEKENQATERLVALREQLHEMRNRRSAEISEAKRKREHGRSRSRSRSRSEDEVDGRSKDSNRDWISPLKNRLIKPGPNSKALQKMTRTPVMAGQAMEQERDYVRRLHEDDVPYRTAKRKLKLALQEFYRSLELLKSYALLNRTAFRKLNKKYDKAVNARPPYRYMNDKVNKSWFVNSDILDGHIRTVEDLYARYFERGNHKIAAGKLRALHKRSGDSSDCAFRSGLLIGIGVVFAVQGIIYGTRILANDEDDDLAQQTSYLLQLYGGYFLALLLFSLFTLDCRMWTKNKVNYPFIFEFDARNILDWKQLAEFPSFFFALFGVFIWLNFSMLGNWEGMYLYYPVILICITLVILFLPAPFLHHKARRWFLYSHYRLLLSGLYPVEFRDFFLGDIWSVWDLFMDFSLLQSNARQILLRDITALRPVWIYYVIMVVDPILRFSWIFYPIFAHDTQHSTIVSFLVALAEVVRRGMWTLLRIENEHCANVAQYKAARDTPLPYHLEQFVQRPSLEVATAGSATAAAVVTAVDGGAAAGMPTPRPAAGLATPGRGPRAPAPAPVPTPRSQAGAGVVERVPSSYFAETAAAAGMTPASALEEAGGGGESGPGVLRRRKTDAGRRSIRQAMAEAHKQDFEKKRVPPGEVRGESGLAGDEEEEEEEEEEEMEEEEEELKSEEEAEGNEAERRLRVARGSERGEAERGLQGGKASSVGGV